MDKVLVSIYVPYIEQSFDVYIPINKKIIYIKKLIVSSLIELTDNNYKANNNICLSNRNSSKIYDDEEFVIDTDIRNGTKLILM